MDRFESFPFLTAPFGIEDAAIHIPDTSEAVQGFKEQLASPSQKDSLKLDRHLMNGVGYLSTLGLYLDSIGYRYPYSRQVAFLTGGYPKGAIVTDDLGHDWISAIDDNQEEPDWYIDDESYETRAWKPVYGVKNFSFWPDYNKRTLIWSRTFSKETIAPIIRVTLPKKWILIRRTITNWDTLTPEQIVRIGYIGCVIRSSWYYGPTDDLRIYGYEGPQASRFLPGGWETDMEIQFYPPDSSISLTVEVFAYEFEESY